MFCPDCGVENSKGNKFCRRCGTNLIAIDRAREFIGELTSGPPTQQFESTTILRIVALIAILGILFVTLGTAILQDNETKRTYGPPISLFFAISGFSAIVLICRYLIKLISAPAKSGTSQMSFTRPIEQRSTPTHSKEQRALDEPSYSQQSVIEEPTQQFEDERRVR
jgi:zinc-ribbon domain